MNILFIIGNGFDLNLGLKTKYSDFYKSYLEYTSDSPVIKKLKLEIGKDFENWSDLELRLGEYTEKINNLEEFDVIYEDLASKLSLYLNEQQELFSKNLDEKKKIKINKDFISPFNYLSTSDRNKIQSVIIKNHKGEQTVIDFMVFNYTDTVKKITKINDEVSGKIQYGNIYHIHGEIGKHIIIGINDNSQLGNETFHNVIEITEQIVKSYHNVGLAHDIDSICKRKINGADFICIFGSSIGETDQLWWDYIGDRLSKNAISLIIFTKGESHSDIVSIRYNRLKREIQSKFINSNTLVENFHVGINTDIFKI